ncbi:cytochrome P450 [Thamnidium elegans]|uniref:Cytochrome P450 n=1 Tax=Thamnidium elegans TaxID=101142 RepID=A0A8H7SYT3_9FUNG|nr:hypothetical protein INT48_001997 [Thamnidium elegans]KAI8094422.1 cytochrome P450 [Thamnidium elegans]BDB32875.1 cytochrome P450 monooxygenase [Thamnidium elegans]
MESVAFLPRINIKKPSLRTIAAATVLLCVYIAIRRSLKNKSLKATKEIPSPPSCYPIFGHLFSIGNMLDRTIADWHDELGPILKIKVGSRTIVSINEPKLAHKLFASLGTKSAFRFQTDFVRNHYTLGEKGIAFSQPDGYWKKSRTIASAAFAPKQIEKYMDFIYQESDQLANNLIEGTEKESSVCPFDYLDLFSMNIATKINFGKRFESLQDPDYITMSEINKSSVILAGSAKNTCDFFPAFSVIDFFSGKKFRAKQFIKLHHNTFYRYMIQEARLREGTNLIKVLDENNCDSTEDERIVLTSDFTGAGTDSISVNLSWFIIFTCVYPQIQLKVIDEIDIFVRSHQRLPLFKERLELPYCISFIKECMRFRPNLVFGLPRKAYHDIEIDGYVIPKDAMFMPNLYSMHRNPTFYNNPKAFFPERYLDNLRTMQAAANGRVEKRDHFNFGWGRRGCPGSYLSEVELFSSYVAIMARCRIEPTSDGMPDSETTVNIALNNWPLPFKVKFTKRANSLPTEYDN